jgi:hypothetical protein
VAVLVWQTSSTKRNQPQIARIVFEPDVSQVEGFGCLIPTIVLLGLLLFFLASGGK